MNNDRKSSQTFNPRSYKLFRSPKSETTKDKNGKNVPHLDITEAVLVHLNIDNNYYQQHSRVLYAFVSNKSFDQLLHISSKDL